MANVWRKNSVAWLLGNKRVSPNTTGADKVTVPSKRWDGTLTDAFGKRRQVPLCEDRKAAETMLTRLQADADRKRAVGFTREDAQRERPLTELLNEYETHLRSKGNTDNYVTLTMKRIRDVVKATKAKTLTDVDTGRIAPTLAGWRRRPAIMCFRFSRRDRNGLLSSKTICHGAKTYGLALA
jgi:hypothetical protein